MRLKDSYDCCSVCTIRQRVCRDCGKCPDCHDPDDCQTIEEMMDDDS